MTALDGTWRILAGLDATAPDGPCRATLLGRGWDLAGVAARAEAAIVVTHPARLGDTVARFDGPLALAEHVLHTRTDTLAFEAFCAWVADDPGGIEKHLAVALALCAGQPEVAP